MRIALWSRDRLPFRLCKRFVARLFCKAKIRLKTKGRIELRSKKGKSVESEILWIQYSIRHSRWVDITIVPCAMEKVRLSFLRSDWNWCYLIWKSKKETRWSQAPKPMKLHHCFWQRESQNWNQWMVYSGSYRCLIFIDDLEKEEQREICAVLVQGVNILIVILMIF